MRTGRPDPLPCIFLLHRDQPVHKIMKLRTIRGIQQQTEFVKVVVDIIHHTKHRIAGILPHFPALCLAVKAVKGFLDSQTAGQELLRDRLHNGSKQPFFIFNMVTSEQYQKNLAFLYQAQRQRSHKKAVGKRLFSALKKYVTEKQSLPWLHLDRTDILWHSTTTIPIQTTKSLRPPASDVPIQGIFPCLQTDEKQVSVLFKKYRIPAFLLPFRSYTPANAAPRALQEAIASLSGASLQITGSHTSAAPSVSQVSCQVRIHSPSPQP